MMHRKGIRISQNARAKCTFYSSKNSNDASERQRKNLHFSCPRTITLASLLFLFRECLSSIVLTLAPFFEGSSAPNERSSCCKKGFFGFLFCGFWFLQFSIFLGGGVKKLYKRLKLFTRKCKGKNKKEGEKKTKHAH